MRITAWALAGAAFATAAGADTVSTMGRSSLLRSQLDVLDNRAAQQYENSARLQPPRAEIPELPGAVGVVFRGAYSGPWLEVARAAARANAIPEDLFLRLVQQESGWNTGAVSHKGAIGLAQLMPDTARLLGVDPHDPSQNLHGGARYLRRQFEAFGAWDLALAAYNAGPGAVLAYDGIPPYAETQNYVRVIWGG